MSKTFYSHGEKLARYADIPTNVSQLINDADYANKNYVDEGINTLDNKFDDVLEVQYYFDSTTSRMYINEEDANNIIERYDRNPFLKLYLNNSLGAVQDFTKIEAQINISDTSGNPAHRVTFDIGVTDRNEGLLESAINGKVYFDRVYVENKENKINNIIGEVPLDSVKYPSVRAVKDLVNNTLIISTEMELGTGRIKFQAEEVNKVIAKLDEGDSFDLLVNHQGFLFPANLDVYSSSGYDVIPITFSTMEIIRPETNITRKTFQGLLIENNVCYLEEVEFEQTKNKVTSLSAQSTDIQYPSAKAVWDLIGDVKKFNVDYSYGTTIELDNLENDAMYIFGGHKANGQRLTFKSTLNNVSASPTSNCNILYFITIQHYGEHKYMIDSYYPLLHMFAVYKNSSNEYAEGRYEPITLVEINGHMQTMYFGGNGSYTYTDAFLVTKFAQRFYGLKKFETIPEVVSYTTPTSNTQLTAKKYVDDSISTALASIDITKREIVQQLPTQDISTKTIYMVERDDPETQNIYDEYMYINDEWEKIGSTEVDLSNYYTKTEIDAMLGDIETILDDILDGALDAEDNEY